MLKLQQQLQIRLHRLPDFILQSSLYSPLQLSQFVEQCTARSHPFLSQLLTTPTISQSLHSTTRSLPELSQPVTHPAPSLPPDPKTDSSHKPQRFHLQRLPQSTLQQSTLHSYSYVSSSSSSRQHPQSALHPSPTDVSTKLCFQGQLESEVQNPDAANNDKTVHRSVPKLRKTASRHVNLQESMHKEREDKRWARPEEEKDSVKGTVLKNCPTIDPPYVLRSQNPAECVSVNTPTGVTNGFPQRGLSQNKHKIRVDFKVSFFCFFFTSASWCLFSLFIIKVRLDKLLHSKHGS